MDCDLSVIVAGYYLLGSSSNTASIKLNAFYYSAHKHTKQESPSNGEIVRHVIHCPKLVICFLHPNIEYIELFHDTCKISNWVGVSK